MNFYLFARRSSLTLLFLLAPILPIVLLVEAPLPAVAQSAPSRKQEAEKLNQQGMQQQHQASYPQALELFQQALVIFQEVGDRSGEGTALNNIGGIYDILEQYSKALEFYQQALAIRKDISDHEGEGITLNNIGGVYDVLGEYDKALEFYKEALIISKKLPRLSDEGITTANIGLVYIHQGQYAKALESYQQALSIFKQIRAHNLEGVTFNNVGGIYEGQGQYAKALESYQQALAVIRQEIGNPYGEAIITLNGEAITLNNIGHAYDRLGQYSKATGYYQQALIISRRISYRYGEGIVLNNLGLMNSNQGQYTKALEFLQQALTIVKEIGYRREESGVLNNLGLIYKNLGQYAKSLDYYQQALAILKDIGDRSGEGTTLNNIGGIYDSLGQYPKALEFYQQALSILKDIGDRSGEGSTLNNIGYLLEAQKQPALAIIFLKQAVSTYEQIRGELKVLPKEEQQSYTETVAHTYRRLADLLLQQDRVLEAQQVLDLLKVQELDDFLRDVRNTGQTIDFLQPELEILQRYKDLQKTAIEVGAELADLRKLDSKNALSPSQQQRLQFLAKLETEINAQFNAFIDSEPIQRLIAQLIRVTHNQNLNLEDLVGLQADLRQLKAALLYPLILDDRLELVITTPNTPPLRRVVPVKRETLNATIQQFRSALGNRQANPQILAQQLYTWLIQPLEADLKQANVTTLIYAPDGQLRYIPLAALHDGNQWLIQRYRIQNITARSVTKLDAVPQADKRVFAAAFGSQTMTVAVEGESFRFDGLPFATQEVQFLSQAFPSSVSLVDRQFNRDTLLTRMNSFTLVHLATHGKFLIGKPDNSFLVTGDGQSINLKEIKNLPMSNVDLVVLSACETGLGITQQANGVEVLGLGYQFQRAGAKATIASLWPVSDGGTERLMDIFYSLLKQGIPKATALQQAQIALITGDFTAGGQLRSNFNIGSTPNSAAPIPTTLKHPFYWAPFILIGNGL